MTGKKGRSGGARPGAGRKPAPPVRRKIKALETDDPDVFLRAVMKDSRCDFKDRMAAALALQKSPGSPTAPRGKKQMQQDAANAVVSGRSLMPLPPPTAPRGAKLRIVK